MNKHKETILTWMEFEIVVRALAEKIKDSGIFFRNIHGIKRGGVVIAVRLSHLLDKPLVEFNEIEEHGKRTLLVDDISDSGNTFSRIKQINYPFCPTASLYYKESSKLKPDFYVVERKADSDWITFPWERK